MLEGRDRGGGSAAIVSIDAAGIIPQRLQVLLQGPDRAAGVALPERSKVADHAGSLFRRLGIQLGQRRGSGDAVGIDGVALLESNDRGLRGFGELAVSGSAEIAQHDQAILQDLDLAARGPSCR